LHIVSLETLKKVTKGSFRALGNDYNINYT
jgi:hypothetical protein